MSGLLPQGCRSIYAAEFSISARSFRGRSDRNVSVASDPVIHGQFGQAVSRRYWHTGCYAHLLLIVDRRAAGQPMEIR